MIGTVWGESRIAGRDLVVGGSEIHVGAPLFGDAAARRRWDAFMTTAFRARVASHANVHSLRAVPLRMATPRPEPSRRAGGWLSERLRQMLARSARVKYYNNRAEECLQLAEVTTFAYLREQYEQLAAHYQRLAAAEDRFLTKASRQDPRQTAQA